MPREYQPLSPSDANEALFVFKKDYSPPSEQLAQGIRLHQVSNDDLANLTPRISTDGIFPTRGAKAKREEIAQFALAGVPGIEEGEVQKGNFTVLVVGPFFGGGSARQQAVDTLREAGIKLIIVAGGHTERIFKENCFNSGGPAILEVPAEADEVNKILDRIHDGTLSIEEEYKDPIRSEIRASGGLFEYTKKRLAGQVEIPRISHPNLPPNYPMTAAQKILARNFINLDPDHPVVQPGDVGFATTSFRFAYELTSPTIEQTIQHNLDSNIKGAIRDPDSFALFEDHTIWSGDPRFRALIDRQRQNSQDWGIKLFRQRPDLTGSEGICHTLIKERCLALPGQYIIGTDSHTDSAGVLNAYAEGVGAGTLAASLLTKDNLVVVPESIDVNFTGQLPKSCTPKDAMLFLLCHPYIKTGEAIDKALEFRGPGLKNWTVDDLFVLSNMSVECGANTGIVTEMTDAVVNHISTVRQIPPAQVKDSFVRSDPDAQFARKIEIDLSKLGPMVATPGHPTNGVPISQLPKTPITSAFIGSCTGGNLSDLEAAADIIMGQKVKVPLVVQAASMSVYDAALAKGLDKVFAASGAEFLTPGCGACIGLGPGRAEKPSDVIVTDTNRNWPGRTGHEQASVYLASSLVAAASSLAGYLRAPGE